MAMLLFLTGCNAEKDGLSEETLPSSTEAHLEQTCTQEECTETTPTVSLSTEGSEISPSQELSTEETTTQQETMPETEQETEQEPLETSPQETETPDALNTAMPRWHMKHFDYGTSDHVVEGDLFLTYYKYGYLTYLLEPKYIAEDGGIIRSESSLFTASEVDAEMLSLKQGEMFLLASWTKWKGTLKETACYQPVIGTNDQVIAADAQQGIIQIGEIAYDVWHEKIYCPYTDRCVEVSGSHFYVMDVDTEDTWIEFMYCIEGRFQELAMIMRYDLESDRLLQLGVLPYWVEDCLRLHDL